MDGRERYLPLRSEHRLTSLTRFEHTHVAAMFGGDVYMRLCDNHCRFVDGCSSEWFETRREKERLEIVIFQVCVSNVPFSIYMVWLLVPLLSIRVSFLSSLLSLANLKEMKRAPGVAYR